MVPQLAQHQMKWLNVFEHTWACPFGICYLLFAIPALAPNVITVPGDHVVFPAFTYE